MNKNTPRHNSFSQFTFIDLFAGIGGMRIPFDRLGGKCVFTSERDKYAQQTYEANFGEAPEGDISAISDEQIPDHDILLAGFPCQPFSIIGDRNGFIDTRGTLFFEIERIIAAKRPAAFLLENVKNLKGHDGGRTFSVILQHLHDLGYSVHTRVLNALDFGLPQKRERVIIVGFDKNRPFSWPIRVPQHASLSEILEPCENVDSSLFASEKIQKSRMEKAKIPPFYPSIWHENKSGNISILPYSCALRAGASYSYLLVNGRRRLTGREMLRLQGFPEDFKIVVSLSQLRKQAGNAVPVPLIQAVAKQMLASLKSPRVDKQVQAERQISLALYPVNSL